LIDDAAVVPHGIKRGLTALARNRLSQFLAIGLVLWALSPRAQREREVLVESGVVAEAMRLEQARVARPLTPDEKQRVMRELVEDEVLFREGLRLGIGTDDAIVRARIAERMRGHLESATLAPVTPEEVREEAEGEAALMPLRLRLAIAFVSKERPNAAGDADSLARALAAAPETPAPYGGDRPPIAATPWWSEEELARATGASVARAALATPVGAWSAPIASAWGFYLVRPLERRAPSAAEAASVAASEVRRKKRAAAVSRAVARITADYDVSVRSPAGEPAFDPRAVTVAGRGKAGVD
jgi:hypothetical protein